MKQGVVLLLSLSAISVYAQTATTSHSDDQRAIRRRNEQVLKAYNLGDISTLDKIEDTDFLLTRNLDCCTGLVSDICP